MSTATKTRTKTQVHEIAIKNIVADKDVQPRTTIDLDVCSDYSNAMIEGVKFPPVVLFFDGVTYWLADGFHRLRAALQAELKSILAIVYQGGKDEAMLFAMGANADHGVRRTQADKRRIVFKMLDHPVWALWSDSVIADKCRVSSSLVSRLRASSPGVIGHDVDIRVNGNGDLFTRPNGHAAKAEPLHDEPEPRFRIPPQALTKAELGNQYLAKVARHLRKADPTLKRDIETPIGNADMADSRRCYFLATAHDPHPLFAAIGKAVLIGKELHLMPVVIGHFPKTLQSLIDVSRKYGVAVVSPEALIAETEV